VTEHEFPVLDKLIIFCFIKVSMPQEVSMIRSILVDLQSQVADLQKSIMSSTRVSERICTVKWTVQGDWGKKQSWPNLRVQTRQICLEALRKIMRTSVMIAELQVKIWTQSFTNEHYPLNHDFGWWSVFKACHNQNLFLLTTFPPLQIFYTPQK
jgi:hypothetical protein